MNLNFFLLIMVTYKKLNSFLQCQNIVISWGTTAKISVSYKWFLKVVGSSLLIHAFAYSSFVGIHLLISTMAGFSHSCPAIKLVHWDVS